MKREHFTPRSLRPLAVLAAAFTFSFTGPFAGACPLGVGGGDGFKISLTQQNSAAGYALDCTAQPSPTPATAADGDTGVVSKSVTGTTTLQVTDALGTYAVPAATTASGGIDAVHGVLTAGASASGFGVAHGNVQLADTLTFSGSGSTHAVLKVQLDGTAMGNTGLSQTFSPSTGSRTSASAFAEIGLDLAVFPTAPGAFQELQMRNGGEFFGPSSGFAGSFGPRQFSNLVNPGANAVPFLRSGPPDSFANTLSQFDYGLGGNGIAVYTIDLGTFNAGDSLALKLVLDPMANCQAGGLNGDCHASANVTSVLSLLLDPGFTVGSKVGINYLGTPGGCTAGVVCDGGGSNAPAPSALFSLVPALGILARRRQRRG